MDVLKEELPGAGSVYSEHALAVEEGGVIR